MKRFAGVFSLSLVITACGGDAPKEPSSAGAEGGAKGADTRAATAEWTPSIRTAPEPDDPCAWIPAADVEAVMGKLAEPPRKADGCLYTFVVPEAVAAKRQQAKDLQQKLADKFGPPDPAFTRPDSIFAAQQDPRSYAVSVSVDVRGEVEGEQALDSMAKRMMGIGANQAAQPEPDAVKTATDWDDVRGIPYGFMGRVGHVRVSVQAKAPDVPKEQMRALAERVRDRVPDLPFAVTNPYQVIQLGTVGDPCSLLTKAEVEAVLGPLAAEPYRSSSNWPPLAHGRGFACAYFTPGHHVFAVSPTWSGGGDSFKMEKGIGGLVGMVLPKEEMTVMKGPWDAAEVSMTGALLFLKGDKLLEVHYRTSRATRGDAIKLAATAMRRFAP